MPRRNLFSAFEAAAQAGPYDEFPMLTENVDPQIHLSYNDRPQPFYLICEKDTMLIQMSGTARVQLYDSSVNYFDMLGGDHVYVPAGTAHRVVRANDAVMMRYKAKDAGLEAIGFRCETCGEVLFEETVDTAEELPQAAYLRIVEAFNADESLRTSTCGVVAPKVDLTGYRWAEIVEELSATETEDAW